MADEVRLTELERTHQDLEKEIAEALRHNSVDDLTIVDLKRRKLHVKEAIERLRGDSAPQGHAAKA